LIRFALLGLGLGAAYTLASLGLILVYKGSGVLNFAQGAVAAIGAFAYYEIHDRHGVPTVPAIVLAVLLCAAFGALMHLGVMRPLRFAPPLTRVIATLGVMSAIEAFGYIYFGGGVRIVRPILPNARVVVYGNNAVSEDRLILLGIACFATLVLWIVYRYTRFGLATTAVAENEQTAQLAGRSPGLIALTNWMAGCALAGCAGILLAPISGLAIDNLVLLIVPVLAVGLVGSFSSFPLTLAAALVMGIIQSEMAKYVTTPGWSDSLPFLVVILVLVIRGQSLPVRSHINERLPDIGRAIPKPRVIIPAIAAMSLIIIMLPQSWELAVTTSIVTAILCVSVVVITGYAGQLSLAQLALAGAGGFVATRLAATLDIPFVAACIIGIIAAVPVGLIVGLPALRTRGVNLAIVTFGLAFAFESILFDNGTYSGGLVGTVVKPPSIFGWPIDVNSHPKRYAFAALLALLVALLVASNVRRGRGGRRLVAVRSNERAAAALGLSVPRAKLFAFGVSAGIAGMAGVLIAFENTYVQYSSFDVFGSINVVITSVIGGVGFLFGALIGGLGATDGIVTRFISSFVKSGFVNEWVTALLAVNLIVILIANPNGIASYMVERMRLRRAPRPVPVRVSVTAEPAQEDVPSTAGVSTVRRPKVTARRLAVQDLKVSFGAVVAVDGVSLTVEPGTVIGLMGPNGAGKTTLIDAVTGFVPIARGTVTLDDLRIDRFSVPKRAGLGISRSFQSLELFEEVSVYDNIRVAAEARHPGAYFHDLVWPRNSPLGPAAEAAIATLDLRGDLERKPGELPFGRRRLVAIARAIASEPSILLLDEPAAGLDERETEELGALIRALADEWGFGILLVEHDVPLLMRTCDHLVAIDDGRPVAAGRPEEVRVHPDVIASYLGVEAEEQRTLSPEQLRQ
jgi:ABC-type branched-subunit amino acid transport system ATPase component/branched-subunit amino acid ABC-type transport system permease component